MFCLEKLGLQMTITSKSNVSKCDPIVRTDIERSIYAKIRNELKYNIVEILYSSLKCIYDALPYNVKIVILFCYCNLDF